jgi:hypothetical protein
MKKLVLALLLLCSAVRAEQYLSAANQGGGEIILTTFTPASCDGLKAMYAMLPNGVAYHGCWAYINEKIHVRYEDGERRVYPIDNFVVKGQK